MFQRLQAFIEHLRDGVKMRLVARIRLRLGNCSTQDIVDLLRRRRDDIEAFAEHGEAGFLALGEVTP